MRDLLEAIALRLRRKMTFVLALAGAGAIFIVASNGWSWTSAAVILLAVFVVGGFWALSSFWMAVLRNSGRREPR
jgi:hypothetical protein